MTEEDRFIFPHVKRPMRFCGHCFALSLLLDPAVHCSKGERGVSTWHLKLLPGRPTSHLGACFLVQGEFMATSYVVGKNSAITSLRKKMETFAVTG
jgi:hypothetical protein